MDSHETKSVTRATMKFSGIELRLLAALASDQLFRREFIEPRMPGYKSNPTELVLGKKLVERLRFTADRAERIPIVRRSRANAV